jgi:polysaccharide export outer membrane protein
MKQLRLLLSLAWLALIFTTLSSAWAQAPYRLAAGDTVELKFFYNPELNETVQIRPDGTISLALIGDVQMSGKTASDVSAELQQRYRTIVKDPANTVQIRTYGRQIVYVGGEVARPGSVLLRTRQTVLEAVLDAGGPRVTAASSVVLIRQNEKGVPVSQVISIKSQHRNVPQAAGIQLQAFDVLLLPESKIAQVDRWVDQYIKQVLPGQLNGGFTYLFNGAITGL